MNKPQLPVKTKQGEQNRKWFQRGCDEGEAICFKRVISSIKNIRNISGKFNMTEEWYAGFNCALDSVSEWLDTE